MMEDRGPDLIRAQWMSMWRSGWPLGDAIYRTACRILGDVEPRRDTRRTLVGFPGIGSDFVREWGRLPGTLANPSPSTVTDTNPCANIGGGDWRPGGAVDQGPDSVAAANPCMQRHLGARSMPGFTRPSNNAPGNPARGLSDFPMLPEYRPSGPEEPPAQATDDRSAVPREVLC
jgi:hypothetical protein